MKRLFNTWTRSLLAALAVSLPGAALYAQLIGGGGAAGGGVQVPAVGPIGGGGAVGGGARVAPAAPSVGPIGGGARAGGGVQVTPSLPAVRTPAVRTPAVQVPGVRTPAVRTPAAQVPGVRTPAVQVPPVRVPGADVRVPSVAPSVSGGAAARANVGGLATPLRVSESAAANLGVGSDLGLALDGRQGLRVGSVAAAGLAGTAGLRTGDQILAVNRAWVRTPADLSAQLNAAVQNKGHAWVYVNRNGARQWLNLDVAAAARGRLGVNVRDSGGIVAITNVHPGSVALATGLKTGDVIQAVNGVAIRSQADLTAQLRAAAQANGAVAIDLLRGGSPVTLNTQLRAAGNAAAAVPLPGVRAAIAGDTGIGAGTSAGVRAATNAGLLGNLGLTLDAVDRLRVGSVDSATLAGTAGIRAGDQILAVNRAWVRTPADLTAQLNAAAQADGRAWIYVNRSGQPQWVRLDLAAAAGTNAGVQAGVR